MEGAVKKKDPGRSGDQSFLTASPAVNIEPENQGHPSAVAALATRALPVRLCFPIEPRFYPRLEACRNFRFCVRAYGVRRDSRAHNLS